MTLGGRCTNADGNVPFMSTRGLLVFSDFGYQHTAAKESNDRYIDAAPEYMAFMQQYKKRRESIRNQLSRELYGK